jgi:AraC-like DNA-binding protein
MIPAYYMIYSSYVKISLEKNQQALKSGLSSIENDLSTFQGTCMSFFGTVEASTVFFYLPPLIDTQIYRLGKADTDFSNSIRYIASWEDMGYILPSRVILSYFRLYSQASDMYSKFLFYFGHETFDKWFDYLTDFEGSFSILPEHKITNERKTYSGLTYVQRLPLNSKQNNHIVFMTIDSALLIEKLLLPEVLASGTLEITNGKGEILLSRNDGHSNDYTYITASSSIYDISVKVGVNKILFREKIEPFTKLGFIFIFCYLLMGIICSLVFSWQNSKPFNAMARELSRQNEQIHYYMINSILHNQFYDENAHKNAFNHLKKFIGAEQYRIAILVIDYEKQDANPSLAVQYMLAITLIRSSLGEENDVITHLYQNTITIIITKNIQDKLYEKTVNLISETLLASCRLFIGEIYSDVEDISQAYSKVHALSRIYYTGNGPSVIYANSSENKEYGKYAEAADIQRLYELLIRTKEEASILLIDEVFQNIIRSGLTEEEYLRCIFYSHLFTFIRVRNDLKIPKLFEIVLPVYDNYLPISELFTRLKNTVTDYCSVINSEKAENKKHHEEEIIHYIDNNFSDQNMYIQSVIDRFNISESTLQRLIRNATGHSFSDYLDQKRLEYAYTLIKTTKSPIQDIITVCGYASLNTFYKAFKRRFSIAPSDLRRT